MCRFERHEVTACQMNQNHPPDLMAALLSGVRWEAEVTRGRQQVERCNTGGGAESARYRWPTIPTKHGFDRIGGGY